MLAVNEARVWFAHDWSQVPAVIARLRRALVERARTAPVHHDPADSPVVVGEQTAPPPSSTPILAVMGWWPVMTLGERDDTVDQLLAAGVRTVWVIDPRWHIVHVLHPGEQPRGYNITQSLPAGPNLPGLAVAVRDLFE